MGCCWSSPHEYDKFYEKTNLIKGKDSLVITIDEQNKETAKLLEENRKLQEQSRQLEARVQQLTANEQTLKVEIEDLRTKLQQIQKENEILATENAMLGGKHKPDPLTPMVMSPTGTPKSDRVRSPLGTPPTPARGSPEPIKLVTLPPGSKRDMIAHEILTTEVTYVRQLYLMVEVFMKPLLKAADGPNPIISKADIKTIFSDVELIYNNAKQFLAKLEERMKTWSDRSTIGDIFKDMHQYVESYTEYVTNYSAAMEALNKCSQIEAFEQFQFSPEVVKECGTLLLPDLLIHPIQRIPRYQLLLQELLKHTATTHPDHECLLDALRVVKDIAFTVNKVKADFENRKKLFGIQYEIAGKVQVYVPGRVFLREGEFDTMDGKNTKRRYFFLFNDILMETKQKKKPAATGFRKARFHFKRLFVLKDIIIEDSAHGPDAFIITSQDRNFHLTVVTDSDFTKKRWTSDIIANQH